MRSLFLFLLYIFSSYAHASGRCWDNVDSRIAEYVDLTADDGPIPGYLASILKATRTDPCFTPARHHSSTAEVEFVAQLRADSKLIAEMKAIRDLAETQSPKSRIAVLCSNYPLLPCKYKDLVHDGG